ncbi:MAG: PA14 domain-containing protein [Acidobacteriota bacterium]
MTFIDHLKGNSPENKILEVAFGMHVIEGDLAKSEVVGSDPTHIVTIQQMLGDAFGRGWKGVKGLWFRGVNRDSTKYKFYPGIMSPGDGDSVQGVDSVFDDDTPHSNTAWIRVELPNGSETGIPDFNTKDNPPTGLTGIYECQLGDVYDSDGDVAEADVLITNPADVLAFGCREIRRYPATRVDWDSLNDLRSACDTTETPDYTTLPEGVGLTARYYDGDNFDTLKSVRVDPVIQFDPSTGAPALDISPDDFSARFEGKIKAKYTETYTFYLTHDAGGRLWINNLTTPLIDEWGSIGSHSATIALTADQFYDIKIEWFDNSGSADLKLEWQSTSQPIQVVPQDRLYPKNEAKKKFECHAAFVTPTNFDQFLRSILFTCNGAFQNVNGRLRFFTLDETTPEFDFDETNIVKGTFLFYPRFSQQELLSLPNRVIADGRDLNSRYLEKFDPQVFYDLPELQDAAGRIIEETIAVGNTTRWQALKNLAHYAKVRTAPTMCEFEGMPQTLPVLQGDKVTVTHSLPNWTEKEFLVLEATDKSIDSSPDERIFKLLVWE